MSVSELRPIFAGRKNALMFELAMVDLSLMATQQADELEDWLDCYKGWRDDLRAYIEQIPEIE
jgi:hypothetical protein